MANVMNLVYTSIQIHWIDLYGNGNNRRVSYGATKLDNFGVNTFKNLKTLKFQTFLRKKHKLLLLFDRSSRIKTKKYLKKNQLGH